MNNRQLHSTIQWRLIQLFVLILPVFPPLCPLIIGFLGLNWLFGIATKSFLPVLSAKHAFIPLVGFFLWYAVALLWSDNLQSGSFEITTKLSFILLPVFTLGVEISASSLKQIFRWFVIGALSAGIMLLVMAGYAYFNMKSQIAAGAPIHDFGLNVFFKDRLSIFVHPSYMAMYLSWAIWILYVYRESLFFSRFLIGLSICFLALVSVLLVSKIGLVSLLLVAVFAVYELIFIQREIRKALLVLFLTVGSLFAVVSAVPQVNQRIKDAIVSLTTDSSENSDESTAARMAIWKVATQLIGQEFLIGVGTGSTNDRLWESYKAKGMTIAMEQKLNAHNQFLQTFLTTGLPGVLLLLWMLLKPLHLAYLNSNKLIGGFCVLIVLNLLVESMFETQAGILFFSIFYVLLMQTARVSPENESR